MREKRVQHQREGRGAEGKAGTTAVMRQLLVRLWPLLSKVGGGGTATWMTGAGLGSAQASWGRCSGPKNRCPVLLALPPEGRTRTRIARNVRSPVL